MTLFSRNSGAAAHPPFSPIPPPRLGVLLNATSSKTLFLVCVAALFLVPGIFPLSGL